MEIGMEIAIQRSQPDGHRELTAIAHASKRHWGYPERYLEIWRDELTLTPAEVAEHDVFELRDGETVLGFYMLAGDGERLSLEHCWLLPVAIGRGLGRRLVEHAVARARARGARVLEVVADPNAEGFYARMGARRVGEQVSELEGRPRRLPVMELTLAAGAA